MTKWSWCALPPTTTRASRPAGFHHILDRFGDHARIAEAVSNRPALPLAIVERMATLVTGRTLERLIGRYAVPAHRVAMILHHSREHFLLQSIAGEPAEELRAFAQRLEDNRLLGPTLVMRAIAIGQFGFLLQALSIKANVPISNVRKLMADEGGRGQAELFEHCALDPVYRPLFVDLAYAVPQLPRHARRQGASGLAGACHPDPAQAAAELRCRLVAGADRDRGPDRDRRGACRGQPRGP